MKYSIRSGLVICVPVVLSCSAMAFPTDWYVDASAGSGGNGAGWTSPDVPFNNLQTAIGQASDGDTIFVAQGTYKPGTVSDHSFVMKRIRLEGGYAGISEQGVNPDVRDIVLYETILSGDIDNDSVLDADNSYQVVVFNDPNMNAIPNHANETKLDGFTIIGGYADDPDGLQIRGGGIYIDNGASPRIHRCKITNNYAAGGGAAVMLARSQSHMNPSFAKLTRCVIENNAAAATVAKQDAALLNCGDGYYEIEDCVIVRGDR